MVKSGVFIVNNVISPHKGSTPPDSSIPPQVPPRMKKRGPALPEKPPHLRMGPSSQPEPKGRNREILVAASSRAAREKPVEKRQREPAKLLVQNSNIDWVGVKGPLEDRLNLRAPLEDRLNLRAPLEDRLNLRAPLEDRLNLRAPLEDRLNLRGPLEDRGTPREDNRQRHRPHHEERYVYPHDDRPKLQPDRFTFKQPQEHHPKQQHKVPHKNLSHSRDSRVLIPSLRGDPRQVVLVPILGWRGALWCPPPQPQKGVSRSGSLTSQEGSSDDSSETMAPFPKSVLKKQKLKSGTVKGSSSCRKGGKNVTFNAFATVQLMEA